MQSQIIEATGCDSASVILVGIILRRLESGAAYNSSWMERVDSWVGALMVVMEDTIIYPDDYLEKVTTALGSVANAIHGSVVVRQERYVLDTVNGDVSAEIICNKIKLVENAWVQVLLLGMIAFCSDMHVYWIVNKIMTQLNGKLHIRHLPFAHLALTNKIPLLA